MQILIQAICSGRGSLRDKIVNDRRLGRFNLRVSEQKKMGRVRGWAKLHSTERSRNGAINVQWEGSSRILVCRVVSRKPPTLLVGDFVDYLLTRFRSRIEAISIVPR